MTKLIRVDIDTHADIHRVVIVNMLNGDSHGLFQVCLNLIGQTQNNWLQFMVLMWPQPERGECNVNTNPINTTHRAMENTPMITHGN